MRVMPKALYRAAYLPGTPSERERERERKLAVDVKNRHAEVKGVFAVLQGSRERPERVVVRRSVP